MCGARALRDDAEFVGSLNLLAGTTTLEAVGALLLLGATSVEVVGAVNQLAGLPDFPYELGEAMRQWAASGNF
jgi:hypothetical protein